MDIKQEYIHAQSCSSSFEELEVKTEKVKEELVDNECVFVADGFEDIQTNDSFTKEPQNESLILLAPMSHSSKLAKKPKTYHYHTEWEEEFFFIMANEKCICIICTSSVAISKKANVERHYRTVHKNYDENYPPGTELRKNKVRQLKSRISGQLSFLTKFNEKSTTATVASLIVADVLMKHKKPFEDGDIWKEGFIKAGDVLFKNFKNKTEIMSAINEMSLSRNTVMRRTEAMSLNLEEILLENINKCKFLSLQFDESTDNTDNSQLCVFIRMVFEDMSASEELLTVISLKERTRGEDIFKSFKSYINHSRFPIHKLVSITTNGSPVMVGNKDGFITLCENDHAIPNFISYHCIIHPQALCSKVLNLNQVIDIAFKIVNSIRGHSLQSMHLRSLLEECVSENSELLLHTDVRWLSRTKFLKRFRDYLPEIKQFLTINGTIYHQLDDKMWMLDLAFLCDITEKLNQLNLQLQEKKKLLIDLISTVKTFKSKLSLYEQQLKGGDLKNFDNMRYECKDMQNTGFNQYASHISILLNEFNMRFNDFSKLEDIATFMSFPFNDCLNVEEIAVKISVLLDIDSTYLATLEEEILTLKCDVVLKARALSQANFWSLICENKYPHIWRVAAYLTCFFGSTYLCESAYFSMNAIKIKHRSRLTNDNLAACLRIAVTTYEIQHEKIAARMQCKVSAANKK